MLFASISLADDARSVRDYGKERVTLANSLVPYELIQLPSGLAGAFDSREAASSGAQKELHTSGAFTLTKATGFVALPGGRAYWDHSANAVTYRKVNDRDFYCGRFVEDASSTGTSCVVDLNRDPPYDLDLARDPFTTTIVGTQALGGLALHRRGGAHKIVLSSTNEAQKVDLLGKDGCALGANAIVEFAVDVVSDGAGTAVDVSIGLANATHATDADSITDSVFLHLDANNTNLNFESDDYIRIWRLTCDA